MEFSEPKGIYLQIADRIREGILQGNWQAGERIPSIRELAVELGVNPNTVTKSYQTLMDRQIITNQRGRGYFVSDNAASRVLAQMRDEFLSDQLPKVLRAMRLLDIGVEELAKYLDEDTGDIKTGDIKI